MLSSQEIPGPSHCPATGAGVAGTTRARTMSCRSLTKLPCAEGRTLRLTAQHLPIFGDAPAPSRPEDRDGARRSIITLEVVSVTGTSPASRDSAPDRAWSGPRVLRCWRGSVTPMDVCARLISRRYRSRLSHLRLGGRCRPWLLAVDGCPVPWARSTATVRADSLRGRR